MSSTNTLFITAEKCDNDPAGAEAAICQAVEESWNTEDCELGGFWAECDYAPNGRSDGWHIEAVGKVSELAKEMSEWGTKLILPNLDEAEPAAAAAYADHLGVLVSFHE